MAGNKNSGRRKIEDELKRYKESIKKVTLEELAASKVYRHLQLTDSGDRQGVKEIALPIYLKSKADKLDVNAKLGISFDESFNTTRQTEGDSQE